MTKEVEIVFAMIDGKDGGVIQLYPSPTIEDYQDEEMELWLGELWNKYLDRVAQLQMDFVKEFTSEIEERFDCQVKPFVTVGYDVWYS